MMFKLLKKARRLVFKQDCMICLMNDGIIKEYKVPATNQYNEPGEASLCAHEDCMAMLVARNRNLPGDTRIDIKELPKYGRVW